MLLISSVVLLIILFARIFEELFKIPYTLAVISLAYCLNSAFPEMFSVLAAHFNEIIFLILPLILLPDLFSLSIKEIQKHQWDFSYLTLFSAIATVALGVWFGHWLLPQFSLIMLGTLFIILMATDAATVSISFERFNLPNTLKIYAKGESLFNNVFALILFYFIVLPILMGNEILNFEFNQHSLEIFILSLFTGLIVAFFGYLGLKVIKEPIEQFIILYLVSIISFVLAEYWEIIGLLSLVTAIAMFKLFWERENSSLHKKLKNADFNDVASCPKSYGLMVSSLFRHLPSVSMRGIRDYRKEAYYISLLANTLVFVCIANLVTISQLLEYAREIIIVFLLTSLIRYFFIQAFIFSHDFKKCWGNVLTMAGMKGGLTIIMLYSLSENFAYKEMFNAIVVGVVILSTLIYSLLNMLYLQIYHCQFDADIEQERQPKATNKIVKTLQDIVVREPTSRAYSKTMFNELLGKEIARAQRYQLDMSLILINLKIPNKLETNKQNILTLLGDIVHAQMRDYDIFGKVSDINYAIIGVNTAKQDANILADRIIQEFYSKEINKKNKISLNIRIEALNDSDDSAVLLERATYDL